MRDTELKWFKSYLTSCRQYTKVNNIISDPIEKDFEVPQGSALEALLFIVYINDIEKVLEKCKMVPYADDTLIFIDAVIEKLCYENLDKDFGNINKWLKMSKLRVDENKFKLMEINMNTDKLFKKKKVIIEKVNTIN